MDCRRSEYTIEWDDNSLGNQEAHLTQIPEPVYYTPPKKQEPDGVKRALLITFLFVLLNQLRGYIGNFQYDDVNFNENIGFISKFSGLKELSIRENEVTDLSPLSGLTALKTVNCEDNPISNYRVLSESVAVIR